MDKNYITNIIKAIITNLINKDYKKVYQEDHSKLIAISEMKEAIESYGRELTMPPLDAFNNIDIYEIPNENEVAFDFDLWFDNERGDLTLSGIIYNHLGRTNYSIENIHML
jgi:hypothetical protein